MSMQQAILDALETGRLAVLEMEFASDVTRRTMLLHPELQADLKRASEYPRIGRLKADLESFVRGQEIALCMTPRRHRSAYMGLLEPVSSGTWEIRSRDPRPGIRIFGAFAAIDIFVALHWMPRSRPVEGFEKEPLRDDEHATQFAMIEAEERWKIALPGMLPMIGGEISEYVSEKFRLVTD